MLVPAVIGKNIKQVQLAVERQKSSSPEFFIKFLISEEDRPIIPGVLAAPAGCLPDEGGNTVLNLWIEEPKGRSRLAQHRDHSFNEVCGLFSCFLPWWMPGLSEPSCRQVRHEPNSGASLSRYSLCSAFLLFHVFFLRCFDELPSSKDEE
jgi:hypothetical protein